MTGPQEMYWNLRKNWEINLSNQDFTMCHGIFQTNLDWTSTLLTRAGAFTSHTHYLYSLVYVAGQQNIIYLQISLIRYYQTFISTNASLKYKIMHRSVYILCRSQSRTGQHAELSTDKQLTAVSPFRWLDCCQQLMQTTYILTSQK